MTGARTSRPPILHWLVLAGLALGLAFYFRYWVIQPPEMGLACVVDTPPWWCFWRDGLVLFHQKHLWAWIAMTAAVIAVFAGGPRWIAILALVVGLIFGPLALVLYNTAFGATAILLCLLRIGYDARRSA